MIDRKDILTLDYYKKERFTGSYQGMRYLIERAKEGDLEQFVVYTWPGPYAFSATKEEKKIKTFPSMKNLSIRRQGRKIFTFTSIYCKLYIVNGQMAKEWCPQGAAGRLERHTGYYKR